MNLPPPVLCNIGRYRKSVSRDMVFASDSGGWITRAVRYYLRDTNDRDVGDGIRKEMTDKIIGSVFLLFMLSGCL